MEPPRRPFLFRCNSLVLPFFIIALSSQGLVRADETASCVDIIFLLDESGAGSSWWPTSWGLLKAFIANMTYDYTIGPYYTRFAIIGFGDNAVIQVDFTDSTSAGTLIEKIWSVQPPQIEPYKSRRNTTDAFITAFELIVKNQRCVSSSTIVILITDDVDDGGCSEATLMAAAASLSLVQFYVRTFLVSLTDYSQQPDDFRRQMEMLQTATKGVPYQLSNYSSLATSTLRQDVKNAAQSGSSCYYCTCAADIVVLIDQSALICETDYENYVVPFLQALPAMFGINKMSSHMAAIQMCSIGDTRSLFDFSDPQNIWSIEEKFSSRNCVDNVTSLETALNLTYTTVFTDGGGARPLQPGFTRLVIIITQSPATDSTYPDYIPTVDKLIQDKEASIFAIGIGAELTPSYLEMLTGHVPGHWFSVDHFGINLFAVMVPLLEATYSLITQNCQSLFSTEPPVEPTTPVEHDSTTVRTTVPLVTTTTATATTTAPPSVCIDTTQTSSTTSVTISAMTSGTKTWITSTTSRGITGSITTIEPSHTTKNHTTIKMSSKAYADQIYKREDDKCRCQNLTECLLDLSKGEITSSTATDVAEQLLLLLLNCTTVMSEYDIYLTVSILYNISITFPMPHEAFDAGVHVVDAVLAQDQGTIRRSNYLYNSTEYIQQFFFQSAAHTNCTSIVVETANVFVTIQEVTCDSSSEQIDQGSIGLTQYRDGTVCTTDQESSTSTEQDVEAFIQLPLTALCPSVSGKSTNLYSETGRYRTSSVLYRTQKPFGKEAPLSTTESSLSSRSSLTASPCDQQLWAQSDFVTTMDVIPGSNISEGAIPHIRVSLADAVMFGAYVKNGSDELLHAEDGCGHWNDDHGWITDGCRLVQAAGDVKRCECNHLTDFTLIVDTSLTDPTLCDPALSKFSLALSILSIIALFIALTLHFLKYFHSYLPNSWQHTTLFKALHYIRASEKAEDKRTVIEWLMASMLIFVLLFVLLSDQETLKLSDNGCEAAAAVLYCILLCTFVWTAFATINYFKIFFKVFHSRTLHHIVSKKVMFPVACGAPIFITVVIWLSNQKFYCREDNFCWIRPNAIYVIPGVVLPLSIFIILDLVLTVIIIRSIFFHKVTYMQSAAGRKRASIRNGITLLGLQFTLGLPWVLQYGTIGFASSAWIHYMFVFFNATQGFWLALLYITSWIEAVMEARQALEMRSGARKIVK